MCYVYKYGVYYDISDFKKDFENIEKEIISEYKGDYYLSPEKVSNIVFKKLLNKYSVQNIYIHVNGEDLTVWGGICELYDLEEKQKYYNQIMSKFIDREKAFNLLKENMYDVEYYFSDMKEIIARILELKKEDNIFYYKPILSSKEVLEKVEILEKEIRKEKPTEEDIGIVEPLINYIYDCLSDFVEETCKDFGIFSDYIDVGYEWSEFRVYFNERFLKNEYYFDKDKAAKEIFEYMEKYYDFYKVLDYDNFESENENTIEAIYIENLHHPEIEKLIKLFTDESKKILDSISVDDIISYIQ